MFIHTKCQLEGIGHEELTKDDKGINYDAYQPDFINDGEEDYEDIDEENYVQEYVHNTDKFSKQFITKKESNNKNYYPNNENLFGKSELENEKIRRLNKTIETITKKKESLENAIISTNIESERKFTELKKNEYDTIGLFTFWLNGMIN